MKSADHPDLIKRTADFVRETMSVEGSHDWFHIQRVWNMVRRLSDREGGDRLVIEMASLLHDVDDYKLQNSETSQSSKACGWMERHGMDKPVIEHISEIIHDLSFKGSGVPTPMRTLEGKIVQDADRLDAMGAIGIARAFAYGGSKGRALYDPEIPPRAHNSFDSYKKEAGPTINHFYEKLLLLNDRMNTGTAKAVAEIRHEYMKAYMDQFMSEWNGTDHPITSTE